MFEHEPLQLRGEREELAPGSTYHAAKLGDEHVVVRGLTRRTHLGPRMLQRVLLKIGFFANVSRGRQV